MTTTKKPRGFAALHPDHVKAIASKGGKVAHAQGRAHEFSSAEARVAGAKGGKITAAKKHAAKHATTDGSSATKNDMVVDVMCSSAAGCGATGVPANSPQAAEAIGAPYHKSAKGGKAVKGKKSSEEQAVADGSSADENPEQMGHCGSAGCGSHKG